MGAEFNLLETVQGSEGELRGWFADQQAEARYMNGHGGYTGSVAECAGIEATRERFDSRQAARDWLLENARKWGPALAVRLGASGENRWLVGAWCSS